MRAKGSEEYEDLAKKCNSLAEVRNAAQKHPNFKAESLDSLAPVKILLADLFRRLESKGKSLMLELQRLKQTLKRCGRQ